MNRPPATTIPALLLALATLLTSGPAWAPPVLAQDASAASTEQFEARVVEVLDEQQVDMGGRAQLVQTLQIELTRGDEAGRSLIIEHGQWAAVHVQRYQAGDRIIVERATDAAGGAIYYITDYQRRAPMLGLFLLFVLVALVVGRARGAASLIGMGLSFLVLFAFVLPQIEAGRDPILVAILAAALIIPFSFYLAHGRSWKTTAAVIGTLITLLFTGLLAQLAVRATRLTGYASEEAYFIQAADPGQINLRGLLLASIIIGLLGILDDITISQSAIVQQLRQVSPEISLRETFSRAMDVGRDHIASLVNTLVLVYASSALPLLLLFTSGQTSFRQAINYEVVAEEVVRTLVASIGLIAAVPITTALACYLSTRGNLDPPTDDPHLHHHH